jgi:YgiT-type zinc finger domain-containing protein
MPSPCPRCGEPTTAAMVRTTFWHDDRPAIVEDIPALVCSACMEQFYDEDVSDALRRLAEEGFPVEAAEKEIPVAVFSLTKRIRRRAPLPDDSYVD